VHRWTVSLLFWGRKPPRGPGWTRENEHADYSGHSEPACIDSLADSSNIQFACGPYILCLYPAVSRASFNRAPLLGAPVIITVSSPFLVFVELWHTIHLSSNRCKANQDDAFGGGPDESLHPYGYTGLRDSQQIRYVQFSDALVLIYLA